jgi:predicted DCC family thiol-disulfide oxidoreductase YuxK
MMSSVYDSTLIFDGDCGFCSASVRFIERHIPTRARMVPWRRADLAELGLTAEECAAAVQWVGADGRRGAGPVAVGYLLQGAGRWWKPLGWLMVTPPGRWLAWPAYRWVARHRYKLPGGTPACALPLTHGDGRRSATDGV